MTFKLHPLAAAVALTVLPPAYAQQTVSETSSSDAVVPTPSVSALPPIIVSANPLGRDANSLTVPVTVLESHDLTMRRRGTLGELLDGVPGVHADTFGGGASRPVIRGQAAPRVKVLIDGSEVVDASTISPDHVVTVDTLLARRVEVLRGPSALLYGGDAIGGVVNVLDDKIPVAIPEGGISGSAEIFGSTAAKERAGAVGVTVGEGHMALRVEGAKRLADNYRVPDWQAKRVANTNAETSTGSIGLSFIGARGYIGAAYSYREDVYGLPGHSHEYEGCHTHGMSLACHDSGHDHGSAHGHGDSSGHGDEGGHAHDLGHDHGHDHGGGHDHDTGHDHDHAHGDHAATAHLRSKRLDIRGELRDPFAGFEVMRFRGGYTDYRHDERDDGIVGTVFRKHGFDARVELQHRPVHGWRGVIGLQTARYDFSSEGGSENFMPRTRTRNTGMFVLEEYQWNDVRFELGARHERQSIKPQYGEQPDFSDGATSFSAGAVWQFQPAYAASLSLSRSQRMPTAQELYADGRHFATNAYELGDASLGKETARTIDLGLRKIEGDFRFDVNLFHSRINGYIYGATLDQIEDFRLIRYSQKNAQFSGVEAQATYRFSPLLSATVFGDYVRGKLRDNEGNLPRIPSARLGVRANVDWQQWSGFVEYAHVFRQDKVAEQEHEQETAGYGMLGLGVAYSGSLGATNYQVYLRGSNLLNKLAYNQASFVSRAAPIQGRSLQAGVRVEF